MYKEKRSMTLTSSGDSLMVKRLPQDYSELKPLADFINSAEARLTNLECVIINRDCYASSYSGGTWVGTEKATLTELQKFGFNFFGCANNHSLDYSYDGLLNTVKVLEDADVAYAGIGRTLYDASRPAYLDLPNGRLAIISVCATFNDAARAGEQTPSLRGRPGLNALRHSETYTVTEEHFNALKEIAGYTYVNGSRALNQKTGFTAPDPEGTFFFGGKTFKLGDKLGKESKCNANDLARITKTIEEAKDNADYVAVMAHSHEIKADKFCEPDYFFIEFCHAVIDAGACAVLGGGTHQLKPIEIYKGKPIFYSLGNFIFQNNSVKYLPADFCEQYKIPLDSTTPLALRTRSHNGTVGLHMDRANYLTVLPRVEFEGDEMVSIKLKPVELGYGLDMTFNGIPREADEQSALDITAELNRISADFGTSFTYENGLISVKY